MKFIFFIFIFVISSIHANQKVQMRLPPTITKDIEPIKFGRKESSVKFTCEAVGVDQPQYSWYKDGELIFAPGANGNIELPKPNILDIKKASKADEGKYFCEAKNSYGVARTNTTDLKIANLHVGVSSKIKTKIVKQFESLKLECDNIESTPKASFKWAIKKDSSDDPKSYITMDKRRAIDDEGALHFSYVTLHDEFEGSSYSCEAKNHINDHTQGTGYVRLQVEKADRRKVSKPKLLFATGDKDNDVVKAVVGDNVELRCFYSSYPFCKMEWRIKTKDSSGREVERVRAVDNMEMKGVVEMNSGAYVCECSIGEFASEHRIDLIVESKPTMLRPQDTLKNLNITEGEEAVFNCRPHSNPPSTISWSKDGVPMEEKDLQSRWSMSEDRSRLMIRDVCKECSSASDAVLVSDLSVIQCDVENTHAHYTYSAYLNVIRKTEVKQAPESISVNYENDDLEKSFHCTATTDPLTPLSLRWRFLPKGKSFEENVHSVDGKIVLENDNTTLLIRVQNSTQWPQHEGKYTCVATNGYSPVTSQAELSVVMPVTLAPEAGATVMSAGLPWWLFLLVVLLLLLLVLLLFCCCLWREKGGVYKVDLKERKNGNDPVKELKEDQFKDYQRPSTDFLKGSRASLGSSIPMNSDDEGSLNEYGDIDAGKFGEDGSFIGDYNTDTKNKQRYSNNNNNNHNNSNTYSNGNGTVKGNVFNPNTFGANGYQRV